MERDFTVKSPDGQTIVVRADESATDEQLIALAKAQTAMQKPAATFEQKMLSSVPARLLKGVKDPIDAGAQMLPRALSGVASGFGMFPNRVSEFLDDQAKQVDADIKGAENQYQAARWATGAKDGEMDLARITGNIVSPANIAVASRFPAAATTGARIVGGIGSGLAGGMLQPVTDTSETSFAMQKTGQGAVGAVAGGVFAPIAGKVVDVLAPKVKALSAKFTPEKIDASAVFEVDDAINRVMQDLNVSKGEFPPELKRRLRDQVLESLRKGEKLDASALVRKMDFDAQGVPYLQPQVTRNPGDYSTAMNLRGVEGVGEPIANRLQAQNQKITQGIAKYGGPQAMEAPAAGRIFIKALSDADSQMSEAVKRAYNNARASTGKDWDIPLQGLAQDAQSVIDDFGVGAERNSLPTAVFNRLKTLGIVGDDGMTQRKVFNYEEADKLLKQINSHLKGDRENGALNAIHGKIKQALMQEAGPGDPFGPARKLAAQRFKLHEAIPALEAAAKGDIAPDDFVQKFVISGKVDEVARLAKMLPTEAKDEAKKQIASVIYQGAFRNNATGDKAASPAGLQDAMRKIGTEKMAAFFNKKEIEELQRLTRITAYANTEPAWGTVAKGGNPGGVLFNSLARASGSVPSAVMQALPIAGRLQQSLTAQSLLSNQIPKTANLSPKEIAFVNGLLGGSSAGVGGLLAPGP